MGKPETWSQVAPEETKGQIPYLPGLKKENVMETNRSASVIVWHEYRPDARQYKQQSIEVLPLLPDWGDPSIKVEIELPVELLANAEAYLQAQIAGNQLPKPIFTPKAVKYLVDEWEKYFPSDTVTPDDFKPATENPDDAWDDDTPKTNSEKATEQLQSADDANWDELDKTTEDKPDAAWDETQEDWGTEPNFDN